MMGRRKMKKMTKLLTCVFLLAGLAALSACTSTFSRHGSRAERGIKFGGPREDQTVVYFDSAFRPEWKKIYAYAYYNNGERTNGSWPGVEMQVYSKGIYFYTMPLGLEDALVIFNNGEGEQLGDVPIVKEAQMLYNEEGQWVPWFN